MRSYLEVWQLLVMAAIASSISFGIYTCVNYNCIDSATTEKSHRCLDSQVKELHQINGVDVVLCKCKDLK